MRQLTVREVGDYYADRKKGKKPKLQIRLEGRWLSSLGLAPGDRVVVYETEHGMEIRKADEAAVLP